MSVVRCPHCGTANRAGSNFCNSCGTELRAAEERAADERAAREQAAEDGAVRGESWAPGPDGAATTDPVVDLARP